MALRLEDGDLLGSVAHGVYRLVARSGVTSVTMRKVAAEINAATSTLSSAFDGTSGLLARASVRIGQTWEDQLSRSLLGAGVTALVPSDPERQEDLRVWVALRGLAATDAGVAEGVSEIRLYLGRSLRWREECRDLEADALELLLAALGGLQERVVARHDPLEAAVAHDLLLRLVRLLQADRRSPPQPSGAADPAA